MSNLLQAKKANAGKFCAGNSSLYLSSKSSPAGLVTIRKNDGMDAPSQSAQTKPLRIAVETRRR
jgi:hypothetical protein